MSILVRIKRLVIAGRYVFTEKAQNELARDNLEEQDVVEAILNATSVVTKTSTSPWRRGRRERVQIIVAPTYDGILVYTKGVIRGPAGSEILYVLISSKRST